MASKYASLSVDELNQKSDELDAEIATLREEKRKVSDARKAKLEEEHRIVQLSNLTPDVLDSLGLEKPLLAKVKAYKEFRGSNRAPEQRTVPEPIKSVPVKARK